MLRRIMVGLAMCTAVAGAHAQRTIVGITGTVYRYHGDTVWMERDSSMTRAIYTGDTVVTLRMVNDVSLGQITYVMSGDSARVIEARDASGRVATPPNPARAIPALIPMMTRRSLEMELRTVESRSRVAGVTQRYEPPLSPEDVRHYAVSDVIAITQHRDTLWYVHGCANAHADTTTFLLFGVDSVRRISSPARTFGAAMAQSLVASMRSALLHSLVETSMAPLPADLPKLKPACP